VGGNLFGFLHSFFRQQLGRRPRRGHSCPDFRPYRHSCSLSVKVRDPLALYQRNAANTPRRISFPPTSNRASLPKPLRQFFPSAPLTLPSSQILCSRNVQTLGGFRNPESQMDFHLHHVLQSR